MEKNKNIVLTKGVEGNILDRTSDKRRSVSKDKPKEN